MLEGHNLSQGGRGRGPDTLKLKRHQWQKCDEKRIVSSMSVFLASSRTTIIDSNIKTRSSGPLNSIFLTNLNV